MTNEKRSSLAPMVLLVLLGAALFFSNIAQRDFWAPDEPRFAQVAQEMMDSGDWIVPHLNDKELALLPPMTYWAVAAASVPFGKVNEAAARIPIALMALFTVLATYQLGRLMFGRRAGLMSALVLMTAMKFTWQASWLQADMLLVGFVTLVLAAFYFAYECRQPALYLSCYALAGLGMLSKGPVAVVLTGMVAVLFLLLKRDFAEFKKVKLPWGIILFLLVVVPWYLLACLRGGKDFTVEMLLKHNFGMFFQTWSHHRPVYYYFVHFPWAFLPWTAFLPVAVVHLLSEKNKRRHSDAVLFVFVWAVSIFLFFTASQAKQQKYILPMFPAVALMVGKLWADFQAGSTTKRVGKAITILTLLSSLILVAASIVAMVVVRKRFPDLFVPCAVLSLIMIACSAAAALFVLRARRTLSFASWVALAVLLWGCYAAATPRLNDFKSARKFCARLCEITGSEPLIGMFGISWRQTGAYLFYTGKRLALLEDENGRADDEQLRAFMEREGPRFCITTKKCLPVLERCFPGEVEVLLERKIGHRDVCLVTRRRKTK